MQSSSNRLMDQPVEQFVQTTFDCDANTPARQAAAYLAKSPVHVVLVTRPNSKHLIGVITVSDLQKMDSEPPPEDAGHLATTDQVIAVTSETPLGQVARILDGENSLRSPLKQVPVVNRSGDALGVITRDYLSNLLSSVQRASYDTNALSY